MKRLQVLIYTLLLFISSIKADEGMWLLPLLKQLNEVEMTEMGLELTAEDIYSVDTSSLKDAVVIFGSGCTGEFVSDEGLLMTNHHCGYSIIQQHSTVEKDYLKDGYWAKNREAEISSPGLSVKLLVSIENVTDSILTNVNGEMKESVRKDSVESAISRYSKSKDINSQVVITPFFSGNEFYRFVYREYTDVRFVGAPPSSIGKFGADTDNWMWPRHAGDFALFRVYAAPDGSPADYSEDNVPYIPRHHFKISMRGVEDNDFTMIMGFPGSTSRYMTSYGVDQRMRIYNQILIDVRKVRQDIWLEDMKNNPAVNIMYANKYASSSNYYKNSIGMNRQLRKLNVINEKRELESNFTDWVNVNQSRIDEYGDVLDILKSVHEDREDDLETFYNVHETLCQSIEIFNFAIAVEDLVQSVCFGDEDSVGVIVDQLKSEAERFYKNYNPATEKKMTTAMLSLFKDRMEVEKLPQLYGLINGKFGSCDTYSEYLFEKSIFANKEKFHSFIEKPKARVLKNDPALIAANSIIEYYNDYYDKVLDYNDMLDYGNRKFEKGIQEMMSDKFFYPDANFTMRLTYGNVGDYNPADGVHYNYFTTLAGVMEKEDSSSWEFVVSQKLKELYKNKDYGRYADSDDTMHVCFITNNDITGGNSGSPVLNSKGELIGLAFDSNWEGMSGDISFENDLQRVVNVDIRYVLFIIDKFAGAKYLIDEMDLVE